jgi:hypothetical protein
VLTCHPKFDTVEEFIIPAQTQDYAGFHRQVTWLTILVVLAGTPIAFLLGGVRVGLGFVLGGIAAILHVRLLGRAVGRFERSRWGGMGSAVGRIALIGVIMFLAVKRHDLFAWWAALVGFLSAKIALGLTVVAPNFWASQRGKTHG